MGFTSSWYDQYQMKERVRWPHSTNDGSDDSDYWGSTSGSLERSRLVIARSHLASEGDWRVKQSETAARLFADLQIPGVEIHHLDLDQHTAPYDLTDGDRCAPAWHTVDGSYAFIFGILIGIRRRLDIRFNKPPLLVELEQAWADDLAAFDELTRAAQQ